MNITTSVIIPSLNSPIINRVIASVKEQLPAPNEIIVVGRDDPALLADRSGIHFLETATPISAPAARNRGAAVATGEVLCFLDSDCLPSPEWLRKLIARYQRGAGIVGGGVILPPQHTYWHLCDNLAVFADFLSIAQPGERPFLPSLNFSIRRSIFETIGGFDEDFVPSGEDVDLCLRLRRRGYQLFFEPAATVTHESARDSFELMWERFRTFGGGYVAIQQRHEDVIGSSLRYNISLRAPQITYLASPLLALIDSLLFYQRTPRLWRYWHALPGIVAARLAWYVGLVRQPKGEEEEA
jgi:GT2 family glycosyltransferase